MRRPSSRVWLSCVATSAGDDEPPAFSRRHHTDGHQRRPDRFDGAASWRSGYIVIGATDDPDRATAVIGWSIASPSPTKEDRMVVASIPKHRRRLLSVPQLGNARRYGVDVAQFPRLAAIEAACLTLEAFRNATPDKQPDAE